MDMNSDQGILVVDLEHCVPSDSRHYIKRSCDYDPLSTTLGHDVLQLEGPVQCLNDINQSLSRLQQQDLTELQTIPYQEIQISYGHNVMPEDLPLYQTPTLQTYSPSQGFHTQFLTTLSPESEAIPVADDNRTSPQLVSLSLPQTPAPDLSLQFEAEENLRFPINDYQYYKEIEVFLKTNVYPVGVSDQYKTHLQRRARHYVIKNNELCHNPNKPKQVVMRKEDQTRLLESSHISSDTGIHNGIKKMMEKISEPYFWRGMYEDISNHVNSCPKCRDSVDVALQLEKEKGGDVFVCDKVNEVVQETPKMDSINQTSSNIWTNVEIQVHGPFKPTTSNNEFVVTITDVESCFVLAAALPSSCSSKLTDFIVKTFYTFGFPNSYVVVEKKLFGNISSEYNSKLKYNNWKSKLIWRENTECSWVGQLVELLIRRKNQSWDTELDKFMFQFRLGSMRDAFFIRTDSTPFYSMFHRSPCDEDKENYRKKVAKKKKTSIQCEDCDEEFTTRVMYKQHCRRHLLEKSKSLKVRNAPPDEDSLPVDVVEENVAWAVGEMKNYLSETKDTRRKRGKYQRYSVELQEHMIGYALKKGAMKAAVYFSQIMGSPVSDSTIRNLVRSSKHFQPRVKEDIARYALEHGAEKTSEHFSKLLNKDVSIKLVKKFKAIYACRLQKNEPCVVPQSSENKRTSFRDIDSLTEQEREEIGKYACSNSIIDTVNYFSEKLRIFLVEDCVQECHKAYLIKLPSIIPESEPLTTDSSMFSNVEMINDCNYTYPTISFQSHSILNETNTVEDKSKSDNNGIIASNQESGCSNTLNNDPNTRHSSSDESYNLKVLYEERDQTQCGSDWQLESENDSENEGVLDSSLSGSTTTLNKQNNKNIKKRGKYIAYSPEIRAKIGKYAAEYGSNKASKHFSKLLGHDLAESTARGLKDKYLKKVKQCNVTSLGYSPRGRPLRLGKYDEVVQECLKEMVRSGERLTAFLVITTAKKILSKLDPSLLKENGGTIVLNTTWAKSFLKRICVRNNT